MDTEQRGESQTVWLMVSAASAWGLWLRKHFGLTLREAGATGGL